MKELARPIIAALLLAGSFMIYYLVSRGFCSLEWKSVVDMIVGALIANLTAVVQYYFGSSVGSTDKTDIMANALKNGINPLHRRDS